MPKPSVGRVVIYTERAGGDFGVDEPRAAIVTAISFQSDDPMQQRVDLKVLPPNGVYDLHNIPFSDAYENGYWSWPKRVE